MLHNEICRLFSTSCRVQEQSEPQFQNFTLIQADLPPSSNTVASVEVWIGHLLPRKALPQSAVEVLDQDVLRHCSDRAGYSGLLSNINVEVSKGLADLTGSQITVNNGTGAGLPDLIQCGTVNPRVDTTPGGNDHLTAYSARGELVFTGMIRMDLGIHPYQAGAGEKDGVHRKSCEPLCEQRERLPSSGNT